MKIHSSFYKKVSTLIGVASLWFYILSSFLDSFLIQRVSTAILLISMFWWYHDQEHRPSKLFDHFIITFVVGFVFFTLSQMEVIDTYWVAFLIWSISTGILTVSIFPNVDFRKLNRVVYILGAILLLFNMYLMYSAMLLLAPQFGGFEVFCIVALGIMQVVFITLSALYYLLSGSDKSRTMMICAVTHAFSLLLAGITFFYHENVFLTILTRMLFLSFLIAFYFYVTNVEVPKFNMDLDNDSSSTP